MRRRSPIRFSRKPSERGMSLMEVTIASAILMVIAMGVLSMMARSLTNNSRGWESTENAADIRTHFDEIMGQPFNSAELTLPTGQPQLLTYDFYTQGDPVQDGDPAENWWTADELGLTSTGVYRGMDTANGRVMWMRETRVRQFSISDLGDPSDPSNTPFQNPLPGVDPVAAGNLIASLHLKEIRVKIAKGWADGTLPDGSDYFDPDNTYAVVLYKAF